MFSFRCPWQLEKVVLRVSTISLVHPEVIIKGSIKIFQGWTVLNKYFWSVILCQIRNKGSVEQVGIFVSIAKKEIATKESNFLTPTKSVCSQFSDMLMLFLFFFSYINHNKLLFNKTKCNSYCCTKSTMATQFRKKYLKMNTFRNFASQRERMLIDKSRCKIFVEYFQVKISWYAVWLRYLRQSIIYQMLHGRENKTNKQTDDVGWISSNPRVWREQPPHSACPTFVGRASKSRKHLLISEHKV